MLCSRLYNIPQANPLLHLAFWAPLEDSIIAVEVSVTHVNRHVQLNMQGDYNISEASSHVWYNGNGNWQVDPDVVAYALVLMAITGGILGQI